MTVMNLVADALCVALGAALGALYFGLLLRTVLLHAERVSALGLVPLHLLRFVVAAAGFWALAREGAMPLLLALLGFLAARLAIQRSVGAR